MAQTIDAAFLSALRELPASVRAVAWMKMVLAVGENASPATFEALEGALAGWPARLRPAWGGWYAEVETTPATGPHDPGQDIFQRLREPTRAVFGLARHVGLWFDAGVGAEQIASLATWPSLRGITSVSLQTAYQAGMADAIVGFARAPTTQHLREYTLGLGGVTQAQLVAILEALPIAIERLWIHDVWIGSEFGCVLADWMTSRQLKGLALHACELGTEGLRELIDRGAFDRLSELTLRGAKLDDAAATHWASRRSSGRLRVLDLEEQLFDGNHAMTGPGLVALAEAGWLDGVESLTLSYHRLAGEALERVLERADLSRLRHLRLHCAGLESGDAARLRSAKGKLGALEHLDVLYSQLPGEDERALADEFTSRAVRRFIG